MKVAVLVARLLLGLVFFVFGLNGFLNFLPMPPLEDPAKSYLMGLIGTGYMMPLIKGVEVVTGALLLAGVFVPFALVLLAPVLVNVVLFHVMLTPPKDWAMGFVLLALQLFLMFAYRRTYAPMFEPRPRLD